ncbi:E3 ubiquitin/ISG15 ligase TRIM25 isoform X1 [Solea solea]|uniref:E3 ubiquitin/ISG15 ligase TRIM25 isoform X1 n=1 Tax=Solea solea TaxID=90069 RepID=UPI00272A1B3A|nr:E3 ubiquitin/ISG15 ligase TRIM25 isoform X1 [Solea solea]
MAADAPQLSLMSLEDELTCSICLSPFSCPVTIPCGHNFCRDCLLASWEDVYCCPQCRCHFPTKPELKKNTVLSTVVETFTLRSSKSEAEEEKEAEEEEEEEVETVVRCDTCMMTEASHTCLTCMASFCEEHLRPHRENPVFRLHQLSQPLSDLSHRICSEHHKLMELFCIGHVRPICSLCLQQVHKGCSFTTPEEQRMLKESDLKNKLDLLDGRIVKNQSIVCQMSSMQDKLKDDAATKKEAVVAEYQLLRDMLIQDENAALSAVDREMDSGQIKLGVLTKKFTENINHMSAAQDQINGLLAQSYTLKFLQTSYTLPSAVNFDPYTPRVNLDSKKVLAIQDFCAAFKEHLTEVLQQPVEARVQLLKSGKKTASGFPPVSFGAFQTSEPGPETKAGTKKKNQSKRKSDSALKEAKPNEAAEQLKKLAASMENLWEDPVKTKAKGRPAAPQPSQKPETSKITPNITCHEKRSVLLNFGRALNFDRKTAHKRISLTEEFTKASVLEELENYPNCPQRFNVCSQVLTSQGFSRGCHYWEVRLSCNNFIGLGLAHKAIDRVGPNSRLGRNAQSWCVEWFNVKLSAWHNSVETVLVNPSPKRVGVLLDCDAGRATFYNVADRAYPFHTFVLPVSEAVFPAFWMFSSGSSISLCKLLA